MSELNQSGRKPFGCRVMVKMKKIGEKDSRGNHVEKGSSIIIPFEQWESRQSNEVVGQIVQLGADAYHDISDPPKEGDYVIVKRYAGVYIGGIDDGAYRSVIDLDIHTITTNGDDVEVI